MLKVGDLARRSGLTVRTLHHYDDIGLLRPSARSDAGYRLYSSQDVARLHGIQALRGMGLSLGEIASLLQDLRQEPLPALLDRQITALDEQIERSRQLRERLALMQSLLATGSQPGLDDWLGGLSLMNACSGYFSPEEIRRLLEDWARIVAEWRALVEEVKAARRRGMATDSPDLQPLARRWMDLTMRWMRGDTGLLERWRQMLQEQPASNSDRAGIDRETLAYIDAAIRLRLAALGRHLSPHDIERLDKTVHAEWGALVDRVQRLMKAGTTPEDPAARSAAEDWRRLLDRFTRHDAGLRQRLLKAYESETFLRAGEVVPPAVREFIHRAAAAAALEPRAAAPALDPCAAEPALDPHAT